MRVGLVGFVIADDFVSFEASFGLRQVHPPRVIGVLYWPGGPRVTFGRLGNQRGPGQIFSQGRHLLLWTLIFPI